MVRGLAQGHVQDGGHEKQERQADGGVKEAFFDTTFRSENLASPAKCGAETGATLLEEDCRHEKDRENDLDDGKQDDPHSAWQGIVLGPLRQGARFAGAAPGETILCYLMRMRANVSAWIRKPWVVLGSVVLLVVIAWGIFFIWQVVRSIVLIREGRSLTQLAREKKFQASIARTIANTRVTETDLSRLESRDEPTLGNPEAKVRIVEFVDYQCPYSREVASVVRAFMRAHVQEAFLILRDFPIADLNPESERVAIAARCVYAQKNADRFWLYHDRLYASQEAQGPEELRLYAQQIGVDISLYDACVRAAVPRAHIRSSIEDALAAGVEGTPTFFFNGVKIQGSIDAKSFETIFQEAKKSATTL